MFKWFNPFAFIRDRAVDIMIAVPPIFNTLLLEIFSVKDSFTDSKTVEVELFVSVIAMLPASASFFFLSLMMLVTVETTTGKRDTMAVNGFFMVLLLLRFVINLNAKKFCSKFYYATRQ